jgi:uncharacterized DUF497 family protein
MDLEWDEEKRQRNLRERGLDFADVARFEFGAAIVVPDLRLNYGEPRFNTTGFLDDVLCVVCWTPRNGNFRVISLRKANARERKKYDADQASDA